MNLSYIGEDANRVRVREREPKKLLKLKQEKKHLFCNRSHKIGEIEWSFPPAALEAREKLTRFFFFFLLEICNLRLNIYYPLSQQLIYSIFFLYSPPPSM